MNANDLFIGVDVGGSGIKYGLVARDGKVVRLDTMSSSGKKEPEEIIDNIKKAISDSMSDDVRGIGIGLPGLIDYEKQTFVGGPNISLADVPMAEIMKNEFSLPVVIENDGNLGALGEQWQGAAKGARNILYLVLGTGFGGGIILDGKIFHGTAHGAGELGHLIISGDEDSCSSGHKGCLEGYVSATALRKFAKEAYGMEVGSASKVYELAKSGDQQALDLFNHMAKRFARGIASLIHIFGPDKIVIGGGFAESWDLLIEPAIAELPNHTFAPMVEKVDIVPGVLGKEAGVLGAARFIMELVDEQSE